MKYNFAFYTGHGIGSVSAHTIHTYYIAVNADNDLDAIRRVEKKRVPLCRYNDAFRYHKCGVQLSEKLGCCFLDDGVIKWQGEEVFASPQVFGNEPYRRNIGPGKYIFDGQWVLQNCWATIYPSYTSWFNFIWGRFSGEQGNSLFANTKRDLTEYYYNSIKLIIKKSNNQNDVAELQLLLNRVTKI